MTARPPERRRVTLDDGVAWIVLGTTHVDLVRGSGKARTVLGREPILNDAKSAAEALLDDYRSRQRAVTDTPPATTESLEARILRAHELLTERDRLRAEADRLHHEALALFGDA